LGFFFGGCAISGAAGRYSFMPTQNCKHPTCNGEFCRRPKKEKKVYVLKRLPLKKKPYKIKSASEKRKIGLAQYKILRDVYMKDHPICEAGLDGCRKKATDIHHQKGRGANLNEVAHWIAVCRPCHNWITEHSAEAIELGLSERRNT
jgi:hypothetical protein